MGALNSWNRETHVTYTRLRLGTSASGPPPPSNNPRKCYRAASVVINFSTGLGISSDRNS